MAGAIVEIKGASSVNESIWEFFLNYAWIKVHAFSEDLAHDHSHLILSFFFFPLEQMHQRNKDETFIEEKN